MKKKNKKKKVSIKTKLSKKINKAKLEEFKKRAIFTKNVLCILFGVVVIYHIGYLSGTEAPQAETKEQVQIVEKEKKEPQSAENELKVLYDSDVKTYMDYRKITDKKSDQYWYIHNSGLIEIKNGYLMNDDFIGVALGSYFGDIGSKYIFTLDTGKQIKVVKVEEKDDKHTIDGFIQKWDNSVIEFVIDSKAFKKSKNGYVFGGNFNNNDDFNGKIVKIEKVEDTK